MGHSKHDLSRLCFTCPRQLDIPDINDDFKRESEFTAQALETAVLARKMMKKAGIPFSRPPGYFCEMLKSEEHMNKIAQKKAEAEAARKATEEARKQRLNRKYGKKVQVQRELEKQQERSETVKKLDSLRRRNVKSVRDTGNSDEDDDFKVTVDKEIETMDRQSALKRQSKAKKPISKKRQAHNERYGFGGSKRGLKRNDKQSVDEDTFDVRKNKRPFRGLPGGKFGGSHRNKKTTNRPGKRRRQQIRSRKASSSKTR